MKTSLFIAALAFVSTASFANNNFSTHPPIEPQTDVAKEYVELGKLQRLSPKLATTVIDVNIATANQCGLTQTVTELFEAFRFRDYAALTRNAPDADHTQALRALAKSLCLSLTRTQLPIDFSNELTEGFRHDQ